MKTLAERIDELDVFVEGGHLVVSTIAAEHDTVMAQMAEALRLLDSMCGPFSNPPRSQIDAAWTAVQSALSAYQSLGEQS